MSKRQCKTLLLKTNIGRDREGARCEIPYRFDTAGDKLVANLLRRTLAHGDDADFNIILGTERIQILDG